MDEISKNSTPPPFPINYFPCLKPLYERISTLVKEFFTWLSDSFYGSPQPKEPFYDAARFDGENKEVDFLRDQALWVKVDNAINGIVNLWSDKDLLKEVHSSGYPPFMQVGNYDNKNYLLGKCFLSVALSRRQIVYFPKFLQEHLLRFTEEQLELQFVIFQKPKHGSRDFSLIFHHLFFPEYPQINKVTKRISIGLYGGSGVKRGTGSTVPWERIQKDDIIVHTDGKSYFHSPNNLRVQMDGKLGTFYVGASYIDCKDDTKNKAYGVMGVVLDLDDETDVTNPALEISQKLAGCSTLKEFVDGCGGEIQKLFSFNERY